MIDEAMELSDGLMQAFLSDERFWPSEPRTLADAGVPESLLDSLICKYLSITGTNSGRSIADYLCLPFRLLEDILGGLRTRQVLVHSGSAPFNDYYYALTENGRNRAEAYHNACAYVGRTPVPLAEYVNSVDAQSISCEAPSDVELAEACSDISVDDKLFNLIGPAVNSGAGMFLFGSPGNGKSTLAKRITMCFGRDLWIPHAIIEDGQIIKLFDSSYHKLIEHGEDGLLKGQEYDRRWVRIRRPTVVVGGELTMDNLEIRHDPASNVSEAPLQMKSNGGCLLIDDFGRQRIAPEELLNRWIVPLEARHDFLTLSTGKKIQVPFEQLIIFSTNLEPRDLVDEAFLRRIPYKIEIGDPSEKEFRELFRLYAEKLGCPYREEAVDHLLDKHYKNTGRLLRRCHPRDLLTQIRNYCRYRREPLDMTSEYFDHVVSSYFSNVLGTPAQTTPAQTTAAQTEPPATCEVS